MLLMVKSFKMAMKRNRWIWIFILLTMVNCATQQERAEQRSWMKQAVTEALSKRQLHIDIRSMNTLRYGTRTVPPDFFLELRGDTLHSYLPYLGQAQGASMASPSIGLNFEAPVLHYTECQPKAGVTRLEIDVRTQEDGHHYVIEVYDTGEALVRVRSQHRDPVSFDGSVMPCFNK